MTYIDKATSLIKKFEGLKLHWYKCPAGKDTIGHGHVIQASERHLYEPITQSVAESLLKVDVQYFAEKVTKLIKVGLTDSELAAIISFVYNIGVGAFKTSTMLKLINNGDKTQACFEFSKWVYVKGKKSKGLINRRVSEAKMFRGDV